MRFKRKLFLFLLTVYINTITIFSQETLDQRVLNLSKNLLLSVKSGSSLDNELKQLKEININELLLELNNDQKKKAFWINIYNSFIQILASKDSLIYKNKSRFFSQEEILIAGHMLSLDEIEHGILRRSKIKLSMGYLNKPFPKDTDKKLRVEKLDYRIHFALNCGASSCPAIVLYNATEINEQLELSSQNYLSQEVEIKNNEV